MRRRRVPTVLAAGVLLAGCTALPDSGPIRARILDDAKDARTNPIGFRIVPITAPVVDIVDGSREPDLASLADDLPDAGRAQRIGPGDVLQISIFELGNGLFAGGLGGGLPGGSANPLSGAAGPSASVTSDQLPPIEVDAAGEIEVPYVGALHAAGRTPDELAQAIRAGLKGKSQNPQVLVRITTDVANSVIVEGTVKKPGRYPVTLAHEHLLDMIAIAGGPEHAPEDTTIRLVRHGRTARIGLIPLEDDPAQDVALEPGDRIEVSDVPRTYTVFGASRVSETKFAAPKLSLAEALARVGGPFDDRADPRGVFLFRFENAEVARRLGLPVRPGVREAPVVYDISMMQPTSYFLTQRFQMQDKDVLFVANARTNAVYKFFTLIGTLIGPGITAAYLTKN